MRKKADEAVHFRSVRSLFRRINYSDLELLSKCTKAKKLYYSSLKKEQCDDIL